MQGGDRLFLAWLPLLCALSAFSQSGTVPINRENSLGENSSLPAPTLIPCEYLAGAAKLTPWGRAQLAPEHLPRPDLFIEESSSRPENIPLEDSKDSPSLEKIQPLPPGDINRNIYYRNKLEFSLDGGWLPINIPFPLDIFVGDVYNTYPLKYTLVPIIASLRWHMNDIGGPWILRGNWDLTASGSVTAIPRGPESRYFAWIMGVRRNFVPRTLKVAPYFDIRLGLGNIDAKGAVVPYAQGEDFTFTVNMGSGARYNISPRFAISAGLNFMHISNLDLSQGNGKPNWGIRNYGINVYGPMVGLDILLRKHSRRSE